MFQVEVDEDNLLQNMLSIYKLGFKGLISELDGTDGIKKIDRYILNDVSINFEVSRTFMAVCMIGRKIPNLRREYDGFSNVAKN